MGTKKHIKNREKKKIKKLKQFEKIEKERVKEIVYNMFNPKEEVVNPLSNSNYSGVLK